MGWGLPGCSIIEGGEACNGGYTEKNSIYSICCTYGMGNGEGMSWLVTLPNGTGIMGF